MRRHRVKIHKILLECPECDNKFANQSTLNEHLKTHNAQKIHSCSPCSMDFSQKAYLDNHVNIFHTEFLLHPDPCSTCNEVIALKAYRDLIDKKIEYLESSH